MLNDTTLGLISTGVPLLVIGFLILRRLPWVFAFFVALLVVGLGYLETTGAVRDIGHQVRVALPEGVLPEHHPAPAAQPAAETPAPAVTPEPEHAAPAEPSPAPAPTPEPEHTAPAPEPEHTAPSDSTTTPPATEPSTPSPAPSP